MTDRGLGARVLLTQTAALGVTTRSPRRSAGMHPGLVHSNLSPTRRNARLRELFAEE